MAGSNENSISVMMVEGRWMLGVERVGEKVSFWAEILASVRLVCVP